MISRIQGKLVRKDIDRAEISTPGGVTYELQIPASVFEALPAVGTEVELHAATVMREDSIEVFGFHDELDRRMFLRLKSATGIGPRLALMLLSAMNARQLVEAIRGRDLGRLQTVSGVGRKKAERIALELGDKLEDMAAVVIVEPAGALVESALSALIALGYARPEAEGSVRRVLKNRDGEELDVEGLVKQALAGL